MDIKKELKALLLKNKLNKLTKQEKERLITYKKVIPALKYKKDMNKIIAILNALTSIDLKKIQLGLRLLSYGIIKYEINPNYSINVYQDVDLCSKELTKFPFNFNLIKGNFNCCWNKLITLQGAPKTVEGNFSCYDNRLVDLKGAPKTIEGHFDCSYNNLTTLEGGPQTIGGDFDCCNNSLLISNR